LSTDQAAAAAALSNKVAAGAFAVTVLDGVTGAGKTEVYFEAIAAALRRGRQALVLLPEIALGAQWLDRFTARFGVRPAQWHSDMTSASGASPGARPRAARRVSSSARARRYSCPSPISASSWSTRNMTAPTSRRRVSSIRPATWRWCGHG